MSSTVQCLRNAQDMPIKQKVEEELPWKTSTIQVVTEGPEAKALAKY